MSGNIINPRWGDKAQNFDFELEDERISLDEWFPPLTISSKYFGDTVPTQSVGFPMSILWGQTKTICPKIADNTWLISGHHCWVPDPSRVDGGWFASGDIVTTLWEDASGTDAIPIHSRTIDNGFSVRNTTTREWTSYDEPVCILENDGSYEVNDESVLTIEIIGMPFKGQPPKFPYPADPVNLLWTIYNQYTGFNENNISTETFESAYGKGLFKIVFSSTFNGFGGDRMRAIDTIHKRLLPQLPCFEYYDQGKLGLAFVDIWGSSKTDQLCVVETLPKIKMDFIYGYNILDRIGQVEEGDEDEIKNNFYIKYNLDINKKSGGWLNELHITHGVDIPLNPDVDTKISPRCLKSYNMFGHRSADTIYAIDIPDTNILGKAGRSAAHVLGEWLEYMFTFRPKYLTVLGDNSCLQALPGEFIRYTEPQIGFSGKPCLIVGRSTGLSRSKFRLRTWENMLNTIPM
jgi:hypothetical protein